MNGLDKIRTGQRSSGGCSAHTSSRERIIPIANFKDVILRLEGFREGFLVLGACFRFQSRYFVLSQSIVPQPDDRNQILANLLQF